MRCTGSLPHQRMPLFFDVGHQCYTHKILTGRADRFDTLRQEGGLSGFPNRGESEHDAFIAGHGNTALSAAIGIAQAKKLKGEKGTVIAVIGDGAFTGGMVYEGMNNIDTLDNLVVILNDNKMSISKNVGSFSGISPICVPALLIIRRNTARRIYWTRRRSWENISKMR